MNPNEFGKKLGIGVRVAGRIAQQRMNEKAQEVPQNPLPGASQNGYGTPSQAQVIEKAREISAKSHKYTRAAGRGVGGFLRPFGRVGGILWLQVTGFFFGLFAVYFATDLWRTRLSYATGPQHQRFLIAVAMTALFGYLSISAFWRARRR